MTNEEQIFRNQIAIMQALTLIAGKKWPRLKEELNKRVGETAQLLIVEGIRNKK